MNTKEIAPNDFLKGFFLGMATVFVLIVAGAWIF